MCASLASFSSVGANALLYGIASTALGSSYGLVYPLIQAHAVNLTSPELRAKWERELEAMRMRILTNRRALVEALTERIAGRDFSFMLKQRGMFSYSGLSAEQVARLRSEFSVYAISTGRICVAALNSRNIDYVADSIAKVLA